MKSAVSRVFEDLLSLKFQKATSKIEVFLSEAKLRQPTGQRQENFNFACSLLRVPPFEILKLRSSIIPETVDLTPP